MNEIAKHHLDEIGLNIDTTINIGRLSVTQRQLVEIAKAISSDIKLLLLDEPTASLSKEEAAYLFRVMYKLKKEGVLVIFVSHVLEEVLQVADRISVLRDGKCVITDSTSNLNRKKIVRHMIGRDEDTSVFGGLSIEEREKVLEVRDLTKDKMAYNINFSLFKGEILGFYGLVGSGRTELAHILIGKEKYDSGHIFINGKQVRIRSIYEALSRYRMGYVTEDRRRDGLIMLESVKTNITITVWDRLKNKFGMVSGRGEREITWEQVGNLNIKATGIHQKVGKLSGGNQQKVNVAKWLAANTDILIIDEPTVGVDVGAKEYFTKLIWGLAENKKSIILISSDMPEIIKLAHRILVFSENRIVGEVDNSSKDYKATSTQIGELISEFRVIATAE